MAENKQSNRGANLSQRDRERGGENSARQQKRDQSGQFAGKKQNDQAGEGEMGNRGRQTNQSRGQEGEFVGDEQGDAQAADWASEENAEEHIRRERGQQPMNEP